MYLKNIFQNIVNQTWKNWKFHTKHTIEEMYFVEVRSDTLTYFKWSELVDTQGICIFYDG